MRKSFTALFLLALFLVGCDFAMPGERPTPDVLDAATVTTAPTTAPAPTNTASPLPPSATPELSPTAEAPTGPTATLSIFPVLTIGTDTVCRAGPGKRYYSIVRIAKGKSYDASGRNEDGSWVALQANRLGDDCWVPLTSLENPGDLSALNVLYTQELPDPPVSFHASANACGANHLWLYWGTVNAAGYRIYRNGKEIATVHGNQYRDLNTPRTKLPTVFLYEIESFNASGVSERQGISVTICG